MVALPARRVLLPAVGFTLLLGLSFWSLERAASSPEQAVYLAARAYLDALRAGEVDDALAFLEGPSAPGEARYAAERRGWLGHVTALSVAAPGRTAEMVVSWSHPERGTGRSERLLWAKDEAGRWRVRRSELVPVGGIRRS